jgi:epoxide hydrolase 4
LRRATGISAQQSVSINRVKATMRLRQLGITLMAVGLASGPVHAADLGEEGFADSAGVKIHYVTLGQGPLLVLIHGFPDYWYTWREQMPELARHFTVVAIDQRGYNKSDQPEGVEHYSMDKLVPPKASMISRHG